MSDTGSQQRPADTNVKPRGADDDVREAPESGEPGEAGRSHGRVIDDKGGPAGGTGKPMPGRSAQNGNEGRVGEDLESGRQDTM